MPDNAVYVIKNISRAPVMIGDEPTGPVYEYITQASDDAPHGTPVGVSKEEAMRIAEALGIDPDEAVIAAPDDMLVVLHDSARKLPRGGTPTTLQQVSESIRLI